MRCSTNVSLGNLLIAGCAALTAAGCSTNVYSPPASAMQLQTAAVSAPGQVTVRAGAGAYAGLSTANENVLGAGLRYGLVDRLEVEADAGYGHVAVPDSVPLDGSIYSGRLGASYALYPRFVTLMAGIGGGYSPAGGSFSAADVGIVLAFENRYFVPFASLSTFVSRPINPHRVRFTIDSQDLTVDDRPSRTRGVSGTAGFKVPMWLGQPVDPSVTPPFSITAAMTMTTLLDKDDSDILVGFQAGVERRF